MNTLREPSLQSSLESNRGSNDSLLADSLQLDIEELDDIEYSIPPLHTLPTLESVLSELDGGDSDIISESGFLASATPTPSMDELPRMGTILRHIVLQGVTSQISSAADRVGSGLATSAAIADMIAIGTSHGHILTFDIAQTLRWCCKDFSTQGTVSALAFNEDSTRLLCGFARGCIIMIDTSTGNTIRTLTDVITPNSGVLNIKWTARPALAICSDSGGSVWSLNFTRKLGIRGCESKCLFSGARGEVCAIEPLIFNTDDVHPLKSYCIAALATLSKILVILIRPRLKVIKYQLLAGPSDCLPLLAWQMVLIQSADTSRCIDPVLAAARGNHLYFHQISINSGKISLMLLRHITLSYNLLAIHWLGTKSMAFLDTTEILHLTDVRTNKELECIDMGAVGLVYSSAQYKGLQTGGNVSPALACAGKNACYNSIISRGINIYFLGARSMHSVNVRSWADRITYLLANNRWTEACQLSIEGYRSSESRPERRSLTKDRILELINEYLTTTIQNADLYLASIINCIIEIEEFNILWNELWELQQTNPHTYFNVLTDCIENENLKYLSPQIAQELCEYWLHISPIKLEMIILKLDWQCLDLHQVLTATYKEKLYNAYIYLNTHALGDYSISLIEFIPKISQDDRKLGNSLLVYISSCLAGRGYPNGTIKEALIPSVKHEVLRCLTSIHSRHASETELPYPYLRALLAFDTRETLNVLSLAFQEKEFSGELGQSHRQLIVNILLEIITNDNSTWSDIGCLLNFISQQISTKNLPDDPELLAKVINYLQLDKIEDETNRQHFEREEAWLQLLNGNCLTNINDMELLRMAKNAKCYRVMEYLLDKQQNYTEIIDCYLNDKNRHLEIWNYIEKYANIPNRKIYDSIFNNFEKLLQINYEQLTIIIIENFAQNIGNLMHVLEQSAGENNNKYLYLFLNELQKQGFTLNVNDCETFINLCCQYNPEQIETFLKQTTNYRLDNVLEILKKYQLNASLIYLYEKQGDYQSAFNLSLDLLKEAPESTSEYYALQVNALCSRASEILSETERETLWFPFLNIILSRTDLTLITRNILYAASRHVNLTKLVQLVLQSGTTGNFGDIKHLLVSMLSNSQYETLLLKTTARILDKDLHNILAKDKKIATRGLYIKSIKCILCMLTFNRHRTDDIFIFGICGHAIHKQCLTNNSNVIIKDNQKIMCPNCNEIIIEDDTIKLSIPKFYINNDLHTIGASSSSSSSSPPPPRSLSLSPSNYNSMVLNVEAPPRIKYLN